MVKVTFTLDERTVSSLRHTAARMGKAQSEVVREAVAEYAARMGRLGAEEQRTLLGVLDELDRKPVTRSAAAVRAEVEGIRQARRRGGRRSTRLGART